MSRNLKILFLLTCILFFFACDKAHNNYRADPKGYTECKDAHLVSTVLPCSNPNQSCYVHYLITDTTQFNCFFGGNIHNINCPYGSPPTVDLNNNSFIFCSIHGYGQDSHVKKSKVLIDNNNKRILCKFLVKMTPGACDVTLYESYVIPKVTKDYTVYIESWITKY